MRLILEECPCCGAEAVIDKRDRRIYINHHSGCPCAMPFRTYFPVGKYCDVRVSSWEDDIRTCQKCGRKFIATGKSRSGERVIYCSHECQNAAAQHRYRERKKEVQ